MRDAHSLYLEMLAELGPVGLALVLAALRLPARPRGTSSATGRSFRSLRRCSSPTSRTPAIDWDWEFPILTLVALGCAGVIVAEGTLNGRVEPVSLASHRAARSRRSPLVPIVAVATLGNRAEAASADAFADRDFERAATEAEDAPSAWRLGRSSRWYCSAGRRPARGDRAVGAGRRSSALLAREPEHWRVWLELAAVSSGAKREAALRRARALNPLESHIRDLEEGP